MFLYDHVANGGRVFGGNHMNYAAIAAIALLAFSLPALSHAADNRCGWIENPTPGNLWLEDKDKVWTITSQGTDSEPEGMDLVPDISEHDYVKTNGSYGYACACMNVEKDGDETITRIFSFKQLKLAKCRNDKALKFPG